MLSNLNEEQVDAALRALADPERRRIVKHLSKNPATVNDLVKIDASSPPMANYQIRILKNAGIVVAKRLKNKVVYRLNQDMIGFIAQTVFNHMPD